MPSTKNRIHQVLILVGRIFYISVDKHTPTLILKSVAVKSLPARESSPPTQPKILAKPCIPEEMFQKLFNVFDHSAAPAIEIVHRTTMRIQSIYQSANTLGRSSPISTMIQDIHFPPGYHW
jgi:hypothetical protein